MSGSALLFLGSSWAATSRTASSGRVASNSKAAAFATFASAFNFSTSGAPSSACMSRLPSSSIPATSGLIGAVSNSGLSLKVDSWSSTGRACDFASTLMSTGASGNPLSDWATFSSGSSGRSSAFSNSTALATLISFLKVLSSGAPDSACKSRLLSSFMLTCRLGISFRISVRLSKAGRLSTGLSD